MEHENMAKTRKVIFVSSAISNFRDKLHKRMGLPFWNVFRIFSAAIFFGLYNRRDWLLFLLHRGKKKVFWAGGDIKNLKHEKNKWWQKKIASVDAEHYCENSVEEKVLLSMGIISSICPMIFTEPDTSISFFPSKTPHVFITAHEGRDEEYGLGIIENIAHLVLEITFHIYGVEGKSTEGNVVYHGQVPEEQFNEEILNYNGAIRLNMFDGFAESVAKSILHGQYPITYIEYPYIDNARIIKDFVCKLKLLKYKEEPNLKGREFWIQELEENKCKILS